MRTLFALALCLAAATPALAYNGDEHRDIGERAFIDAFNVVNHGSGPALPGLPWKHTPGGRWVTCESENKHIGGCDQLGTGNRVLIWVGNRTDGDPGDWATFGELVERYGDHRDTIDAMLATPPSELKVIKHAADTTGNTYNNPKEQANYLGLAAKNITHFGTSAVYTYYLYHQTAIGYAYLAAENNDPNKMWEALHYEARAVHSLTDLFAPGHLFVDRTGVQNVIAGERGLTDGKTAVARLSALNTWLKGSAQGVYDKYGPKKHDEFNASGANVKNLALGDAYWWTYGDGKYYSMNSTGKDGPYSAAVKSVVDLLSAYKFMLLAKQGKAGGKTARAMWQERLTSAQTYDALREVPVAYELNAQTKGVFSGLPCKDNFCDLPTKAVILKLLAAH
ncbi:MAG: hypothetical protein JST92_19610 [Deltaproteobacteria bacterium]|nr:hypothetical protein [Deltaproteobacteria bacterium]